MMLLKKQIEKDYCEAEKIEIQLKDIIEKQFNIKLICTDRYNLFDYVSECNNIYIELKNRSCKSTTYNSTLIGANKIKEAERLLNNGKTIYFVFRYLDCIKFWIYDKTDDSWAGWGVRKDRGILETSQALYIPNRLLRKFR